ncbi:MAG TPA: MauE/DoxX family redox-associated membrane protein [Kineosporiaceae bacterium]
MTHRFAVAQPWLSTAARLFLAGVFIWAGWPKLIDGDGTVLSVRAFRILPDPVVTPFAYALPMVELALAGLLIAGLLTRLAALVTAAMMVMFLGGIIQAWARGLSIECGCFGNTGALVTDPVPGYITDILRDIGFLLVALYLARWPRSAVAVDRFLQPSPTTARA